MISAEFLDVLKCKNNFDDKHIFVTVFCSNDLVIPLHNRSQRGVPPGLWSFPGRGSPVGPVAGSYSWTGQGAPQSHIQDRGYQRIGYVAGGTPLAEDFLVMFIILELFTSSRKAFPICWKYGSVGSKNVVLRKEQSLCSIFLHTIVYGSTRITSK